MGEHLAALEAARIVGRSMEVAVLLAFLEGLRDRVLLVVGEGGIGKSTLLRVAGRLGEEQGRPVIAVDARVLGGDVGALDRALAPALGMERPLLLIDSGEHLGGLVAHLRNRVLPGLPADTQVVIAGRGQPDPGWSRDGWEAVRRTVELDRLTDQDAGELAQRLGVQDPSAEAALLAWSQGLPLAVVAGADIARSLPEGPFDRSDFDRRLGQALVRHLVDDEVQSADAEVLALAAVAPVVDRRLIEACLPHLAADEALATLDQLSFVEGTGGRLALHDRLRTAIRMELERTDEARSRDLRRRAADHLYERSVGGEPHLVAELRLLIADADVRWGLGPSTGPLVRADRVRPGDLERLAAALEIDDEPWWPRIQRWFREAPDNVLIVRDEHERLLGAGLWASAAVQPAFAEDDPQLGFLLRDAAERGSLENFVCVLDVFDLVAEKGDENSPVVSTGNAGVMTRCGLANPRWMYAISAAADEQNDAFLAALGYQRIADVPELDPDRDLVAFVCDHGPGGVIATTRNLVYRDLGLPAPSPITVEVVRDALRGAHDPVALAASPLATGTGVAARSRSVRRILDDAIEAAFGDSDAEQLSRSTVELGYLDPEVGHTRAQAELHLSRTAYFARLARAVDRVAAVIVNR